MVVVAGEDGVVDGSDGSGGSDGSKWGYVLMFIETEKRGNQRLYRKK